MVFLNATKGLNEIAKMAWHIGIVRCGIDPQAKTKQCSL
jgi:hypothetical protein